jgi:hypothetical protein
VIPRRKFLTSLAAGVAVLAVPTRSAWAHHRPGHAGGPPVKSPPSDEVSSVSEFVEENV